MTYEALIQSLKERGMYGWAYSAEGQEIDNIATAIVDGSPVGLIPEPEFQVMFAEGKTKPWEVEENE